MNIITVIIITIIIIIIITIIPIVRTIFYFLLFIVFRDRFPYLKLISCILLSYSVFAISMLIMMRDEIFMPQIQCFYGFYYK